MPRAIVLLFQGVLLGGGCGAVFFLGRWAASDRSAEVATTSAVTTEQQTVVNLRQQPGRLPDDPDLLVELITTRLQQGDLQAAYNHLQVLRRRHPRRWRLGALAAELLRASGELTTAQQQVQGLLAVDPDNLSLLRLHCRILLEQGRAERAEAVAEAAWQQAQPPETPAPHVDGDSGSMVDAVPYGLLLADVYRYQGKVGAADQLLEQMGDRSQQEETDPRPLIAQAMLRQDNGDLEAAQQLLAEARQHGDPVTIQWLDVLSRRWSLELTRAPTTQLPGAPPPLTSP